MTLKAKHTAVCYVCGERISIYFTQKVLWEHKTPDKLKRCEGSHTANYIDIEEIVKKRKRYEILQPSNSSEIYADFRKLNCYKHLPHESWLDRWERKFKVKISKHKRKILKKSSPFKTFD